jgi:dipeptidyl aminopeptidase/acylaminoacyl peptidase
MHSGEGGAGARRPIAIEDLLALKIAGDPQIDPEGARVACTVTTTDAAANVYYTNIWIVAASGGAALRLTTARARDTMPRWSPDGRQIAFLSDRSGDKQVWVIDVGGGEARCLTSGPLAPSEIAWSPDGRRLAVVGKPQPQPPADASDVRVISRLRYKADGEGFWDGRWKHVLVLPVDGGAPRTVTEEDCDHTGVAWSPDGQWLAYAANPGPEADVSNVADIWVVRPEGGAPRRLTRGLGPAGQPAWAPDGRRIAYVGHDNACRQATNAQVWVVGLDGGDPECLTKGFDRHVGHHVLSDTRAHPSAGGLTWTPDGARIFFMYADGPTTQIGSVGAADRTVRPETAGDHELIGCAIDRRARRVACIQSDPLTPGELAVADLGAAPAAFRRISDWNGPELAALALAAPQRFQFESVDGWPVEGWVLRPAAAASGRVPAVLQIHGGPHAAYGQAFFHEFQLLAASGYGVIYMNPRGSQGYGQWFAAGTRHDWGGKDYADLMRGVDYALAAYPWIDPDRLGVCGGSYGGFMTNWVVGHTDRFKAAVTMRGISNAYSQWGTSDLAYQKGFWEYPGDPWEAPDFYLERSPITYVRAMKTPLLILHSENDLRCPIEQAEQLFVALRKLGVPTLFVRFPGESHDLSRNGQPRHRVERLQHILGWLDRYLGAAPAAPAPASPLRRQESVPADG